MSENKILKRAEVLLPMYEAASNIAEQLQKVDTTDAGQAPLYTPECSDNTDASFILELFKRLLVSSLALRSDRAEIINSALSSLEAFIREHDKLSASGDSMTDWFLKDINPCIVDSFSFGVFYPEDEDYWMDNFVRPFNAIAEIIVDKLLHDEVYESDLLNNDLIEILKNALAK